MMKKTEAGTERENIMLDYTKLPHTGIQALHPYEPGKSIEEVAKAKGLDTVIKLASNENPLGCSPAVLAYLQQLSGKDLAMYPHPHRHPLRAALADHVGLSSEQLVLSNGSDALFSLVLMAFCLHTGKTLLTHDHAFASYAIQAQTLGIPVQKIAMEEDKILRTDKLLAACTPETGVIMFANPNNPTGTQISQEAVYQLLKAVPPEIVVLVDEAYFEFALASNQESALPLLRKFPNLIITRTLSKIYGLAGLRIGYALANPELAELLWRVQLPFALNTMAMEAGLIALSDQQFVRDTLTLNEKGMAQIAQGLDRLGLPRLPSACNFITFDCRQNAMPVYEYLLELGVITRPLPAYGLKNYIRVSIGTAEENEKFLQILNMFYRGKNNASK